MITIADEDVQEYECPSCGTTLRGLVSECHQCGQEFDISDSADDPEYECPTCGKMLQGLVSECPHCGQEFDVPGAEEPAAEEEDIGELDDLTLDEDEEEEEEDIPEPAVPVISDVDDSDEVVVERFEEIIETPDAKKAPVPLEEALGEDEEFIEPMDKFNYLFWAGVFILLGGTMISLGSYIHNPLKMWVTITSWKVYGHLDQTAGIIGSIPLIIGIILIILSKRRKEIEVGQYEGVVVEKSDVEEYPDGLKYVVRLREIKENFEPDEVIPPFVEWVLFHEEHYNTFQVGDHVRFTGEIENAWVIVKPEHEVIVVASVGVEPQNETVDDGGPDAPEDGESFESFSDLDDDSVETFSDLDDDDVVSEEVFTSDDDDTSLDELESLGDDLFKEE